MLSPALESKPQTRVRMVSLRTLRPSACIRRRMTSNSLAESRTLPPAVLSVQPVRSRLVFP